MSKKATTIGGQALIEGIMMKGPKKTAISVRLPDGSIDTEYMKESHIKDKISILGLPVIRGTVNFIEAMVSGYKALMISADKSGFTDLEEENDKKDPEKDSKLISFIMIVAAVLGVLLALVLFMWFPAFLFNLINKGTGGNISSFRSIFEGVIKIIIFVGYVAAVSLMNDIKRVFMYHGAEHKTIFCYEAGEELTVENIRNNSRFHPRCGTSFMILMLLVGIVVTGVLSIAFPVLTKFTAIWVLVKILILPLICGFGYELIRLCGRHANALTKIISAPGMWLQRLTTKEPDDSMIEVAIESLKAVLPEDPTTDVW